MTETTKIIEKLRNREDISSNELKTVITPIFRKVGINSEKINIKIVDDKYMKKHGIEGYSGYSFRKSNNPELKKDEVWINKEREPAEMIRTTIHEVAHIATEKGAQADVGELTAEKQAFNIEDRGAKIFNKTYKTNIKKITYPKSEKIYRQAQRQSIHVRPVIKPEYRIHTRPKVVRKPVPVGYFEFEMKNPMKKGKKNIDFMGLGGMF